MRRVRPRATLATAIVLSLLLVAAAIWGWFAQTPDVRARYTAMQLGTLIFFVVFMVGVMLSVGLCWVEADARGVRWRNGLRRFDMGWDEIASIRYRDGDPWAFANLVPGHHSGRDRIPLLGIQQTDGARARRAVEALRAQRPLASD